MNEGIYAQLNAGSLLGFFGEEVKQVAEKLVKYNLVHLIGSDLHSLNRRKQCLSEGVKMLDKIEDVQGKGFIKNNQAIIDDKEINKLTPIFYQPKKGSMHKRWSTFTSIKGILLFKKMLL